jgi:hypothetical protein
MAVHKGKRPSLQAQGEVRRAYDSIEKPPLKRRPSGREITRKSTRRKQKRLKPKWPVAVVMREGKTTIRQLSGRRFVSFGEFRGKRAAKVQFYTCSPNTHTISVHFQDKTVFYLELTPLFTVKPDYYNIRTGDLEKIKEWPEMRCER